ncbi:MAG: hypothetical protein M1320_02915 [Patescibacteria group bacterium]|nr:hypothetical protein [Patescibacteria group bacterium]
MAQQKKKKLIPVTDIVPSDSVIEQKTRKEPTQVILSDEAFSDVSDIKIDAFRDFGKSSHSASSRAALQPLPESWETPTPPRRKKRSYKGILAGMVVLAAAMYVVFGILPRVTVSIVAKKIPVQLQTSFSVVATSSITMTDTQVPGEIVTEQKTNIFKFPATGKETTQQKAKGTVVIFNTYSTAPQVLVATTRLQSPDGKIFRLVNRVVVPGAKKSGAVLEPGSIEADVVADQTGASYNIDPVDKFTIPGFQGSDKYNKFYASSVDPMAGGSDGQTTVATNDDVDKAQQDAVQKMKDSITSTIALKIPNEFTYVKGSEQFQILTKKVDTRLDKDNNFTVALEAQESVVIFKEGDIKSLLQKQAQQQGTIPTDYAEQQGTITYDQPVVDWKGGSMMLPVSYKAIFWKPIDVNQLRANILGKNESDLKTTVLSLQGIDKLTVSFWPFWVSHVPSSSSRVTITVE